MIASRRSLRKQKKKTEESYIGVEQVHAVQALAAVNAALDAPQGRFALAHGQREGGGSRDRHSTSATCSTWKLTRGGRVAILGSHPAAGRRNDARELRTRKKHEMCHRCMLDCRRG